MDKSAVIQNQYLVSTYSNRGITIERGEGVYLIDSEGKKYLDFMTNFGVNILGYGNKQIIENLKFQIENLINLHSSFNNPARAEALALLIKAIKESGYSNLRRVYFSNSGAEAIEAAIKFAILNTRRNKIISASNDYHGKTLAALSVTTSNEGKYQKPFKKNLLKADFVKFGDINSLQEVLRKAQDDTYAAVVLEPIQGEGGIHIPPKAYLPKVSELCKRYGIVLIIDEIQSGLGRTGSFLNIEQYKTTGFDPDIVCLAKGLGYGVPVAATIVTEDINSTIPKGIQTSTFGGNPLAMAGISGTLNYLSKNDLYKNAVDVGNYFLFELKKLVEKHSKLVVARGEGLMIGLEMFSDPMDLLKYLQLSGVIAAPCSGNTIRLLPPLIVEKKHIDEVVSLIDKYFSNN